LYSTADVDCAATTIGKSMEFGRWGRSIDHEAAAAPAEISNGVIDNRSENLQH
jgi:hypothetical protein